MYTAGQKSWIKFSNNNFFDRVRVQQNTEIAVSKKSINARALSIDHSFTEGWSEKRQFLVFPFLKRWKPFCRLSPRAGKKLSGHLYSVREDFSSKLVLKSGPLGVHQNVQRSFFVNSYETPVYFEGKPNPTVYAKFAHVIPLQYSGSNNLRLSGWVSVSSNSDKLLVF